MKRQKRKVIVRVRTRKSRRKYNGFTNKEWKQIVNRAFMGVALQLVNSMLTQQLGRTCKKCKDGPTSKPHAFTPIVAPFPFTKPKTRTPNPLWKGKKGGKK